MTVNDSASAATPQPTARRAFSGLSEQTIIGAGTVLAFLGTWEAVAASGAIDPMFISSPSRVVGAGAELFGSGEIWKDIEVSAAEFVWGYLLSIAVGVPLGLGIGLSRRLYHVFAPIVDALNAVPRITLLPLLVIWGGIGIWSKIAVVFLGAVIPITIYTFSGVKTNEARFLRVAVAFGASPAKLFTSIVLPGTVPFIFTGLKYGAGRALLGVVVGELYASTAGVGHMIAAAGNSFQTDIVFLGVALFTITGLVVVGLLNMVEKRFERWRPAIGDGR